PRDVGVAPTVEVQEERPVGNGYDVDARGLGVGIAQELAGGALPALQGIANERRLARGLAHLDLQRLAARVRAAPVDEVGRERADVVEQPMGEGRRDVLAGARELEAAALLV